MSGVIVSFIVGVLRLLLASNQAAAENATLRAKVDEQGRQIGELKHGRGTMYEKLVDIQGEVHGLKVDLATVRDRSRHR